MKFVTVTTWQLWPGRRQWPEFPWLRRHSILTISPADLWILSKEKVREIQCTGIVKIEKSNYENSCSFRNLFRKPDHCSEWHLTLFLNVRNKLWFGLFQIFLFEIEPERFEVFSKRVQRFVSDLVRRMLKRCPSLGPGLNFKIEDFFFSLLRIFVDATKWLSFRPNRPHFYSLIYP